MNFLFSLCPKTQSNISNEAKTDKMKTLIF